MDLICLVGQQPAMSQEDSWETYWDDYDHYKHSCLCDVYISNNWCLIA